MNKEQDWFFTFGYGHENPNSYVRIHGTFESARTDMIKMFGSQWSFQYNEDQFNDQDQINRYKLYEIGI